MAEPFRPVGMSDRYLGLAFALSSATQLRVGPIGPSEVLLSLWILAGSISLIWVRKIKPGPAFGTFSGFWLFSLVLLFGGLLMGANLGHLAPDPLRDMLAYGFSMSLVFVYSASSGFSHALETAKWFCAFSTIAMALVLVGALLDFPMVLIEPWDDFRLKGWANNPNQFALQSAICTGFLIALWPYSTSLRARVLTAIGLLLNITVGIFTFSDALFVAWGAGLFAIAISSLHFFLVADNTPRVFPKILAASLTFVSILALAAFFRMVSDAIGGIAESVYGNANQGDIRLALWRHGWEAIASSPILGLGPGAHSGDSGPFQGKEAHNSIIDWGMSTGLLGVTLFVWLWFRLIRNSFRAKAASLLGALAILATFFQFHHALRHPVFWFMMIFLFLAGDPDRLRNDGRAFSSTRRGATP